MADMIRAIIIDDEKLARDIIRSYLEEENDIEIVAECANGFDGLREIQNLKPDLIFLDIQMPKITGFEMLQLLENSPEVIFSTAYDQYAIKAFENNAIDYLLKPYSKERFSEALNKTRKSLSTGEASLTTKKVANESHVEQLSRIVVRTGNQISIIDINDISHISATDDYVELFTKDAKYLKQMTMKYLEEHLPSESFVRCHRSHILAIPYLEKIEPYERDGHLALLKTGVRIPISRSGYGRLREILNF